MVSERRVWIDKQHPQVFRALTGVAAQVRAAGAATGLERRLIELVNVRVSQINGCASCLDIHQRAALKAGVSAQELAVLPAWRRTELFTAQERAALAIAEITTALPEEATMAREYAFARRALSDAQISAVIWVATTIAAFNRVSIMSSHPVRAQKEQHMTDSTPEATVVRNDDKKRYEISYGGKLAGFAEYEERGDETVFTHTEIDDAFSGKGLGKVLAKVAIEDTIALERVIRPLCPFIKAYLDKHPEYDAHVIGKGVTRE
ncbi:AhpD family alkylhydroperoxidase [Nocardia goodfellowii]|uniref:AhpD family alkylhydroperoxidase n=2 Tax=Nocardia goodfellowii TaxID=882446 RepID=A0ABS4QAZ6_9NOCA|nr:AhpD family alkylhydroperoxidase [Nocardia goodfellowii]